MYMHLSWSTNIILNIFYHRIFKENLLESFQQFLRLQRPLDSGEVNPVIKVFKAMLANTHWQAWEDTFLHLLWLNNLTKFDWLSTCSNGDVNGSVTSLRLLSLAITNIQVVWIAWQTTPTQTDIMMTNMVLTT